MQMELSKRDLLSLLLNYENRTKIKHEGGHFIDSESGEQKFWCKILIFYKYLAPTVGVEPTTN